MTAPATLPVSLLGDLEAALPAEVDVDQRHVGAQFLGRRSASALVDRADDVMP